MNSQINQIRRLSWILFASLSVNACLASFVCYLVFVERPPTPRVDNPMVKQAAKPMVTQAELSTAIMALKGLTIEELVYKLNDKRIVENGFTVGDLSLAALTGYYFFDIERAIHHPLEKTVVSFGSKGETLVVYPALSENDFAAIESFMKQERWPYRAQGLYRLLKSEKFQKDLSQRDSLQEAFYLTPEFLSIELLLSRSGIWLEKEEVLDLVLQQDWGRLAAFYEKQRTGLDLSEGARRLYLLEAIDTGSFAAAKLLLKTDKDFALKKLEDRATVKILLLLKNDPESARVFAEELLKTPRSDGVKREALAITGDEVIEHKDYALKSPRVEVLREKDLSAIAMMPSDITLSPKNTLSSIAKVPEKPVLTPVSRPVPKKAINSSVVRERIYIVQKNETLSKIAKRFKINIDVLRKMNGMSTDEVKAGRPLRIPEF